MTLGAACIQLHQQQHLAEQHLGVSSNKATTQTIASTHTVGHKHWHTDNAPANSKAFKSTAIASNAGNACLNRQKLMTLNHHKQQGYTKTIVCCSRVTANKNMTAGTGADGAQVARVTLTTENVAAEHSAATATSTAITPTNFRRPTATYCKHK